YLNTTAGESIRVPQSPNRVRLVQRVRLPTQRREFSFVHLRSQLEKGLTAVPSMNVASGELLQPLLQGDQLVFDRANKEGHVWQRVAMTRGGLLVCSFSVPCGSRSPQAADAIYLN